MVGWSFWGDDRVYVVFQACIPSVCRKAPEEK